MEIVTVKMLKDAKGSPDGFICRLYESDKEYDLPKSLSDVFVSLGVAENVVVEAVKDVILEITKPKSKQADSKTKPKVTK